MNTTTIMTGDTDTSSDDLDAREVLSAAVEVRDVRERAGVRQLELALRWADLHAALARSTDLEHGRAARGTERLVRLGGEGTPEVAEFCVAEFAAVQGLTTTAGRHLIADALDLRHRLPLIWGRLLAGDCAVARARAVADQTRPHTVQVAGYVDAKLSEWVGRTTHRSVQTMTAAAIVEADPDAAAERDRDARRLRGVFAHRRYRRDLLDPDQTTRSATIRTDLRDMAVFLAAVSQIAHALWQSGDVRPLDERRAAAIGILADPTAAHDLLTRSTTHAQARPANAESDHAKSDHAGSARDAAAGSRQEGSGRGAASQGGGWVSTRRRRSSAGRDWPPPSASEEGGSTEDAAPRPDTDPDDSDDSDDSDDTPTPSSTTRSGGSVRWQTVLNIHMTERALATGRGVARIEGQGPVSVQTLREMLTAGAVAGVAPRIVLRPVVDLNDSTGVDHYEIPMRIRDLVHLRSPRDLFPYGNCTSRSMDLDHTVPWVEKPPDDSPPQTRPDNLAPLSRFAHRVKTHGGWQCAQVLPGVLIWRSPHGYVWVTDHTGTRSLGRVP